MHYQPLKECLLALRRNQEEVDAMCYDKVPEKLQKHWFGTLVTKENVDDFVEYFKEHIATMQSGK